MRHSARALSLLLSLLLLLCQPFTPLGVDPAEKKWQQPVALVTGVPSRVTTTSGGTASYFTSTLRAGAVGLDVTVLSGNVKVQAGCWKPGREQVHVTTTKGDFVIELHPEWAPRGTKQFKKLVAARFYDGAAFFRVISGFVAQFGLPADPALNAAWSQAIPDDTGSGRVSNTEGRITFATAGPNTRTTQVFINLVDNTNLDSQGFTPFGEVVTGMDVVRALYSGYGDMGPDQGKLTSEGEAYVKAQFDKLDRIESVVASWAAPLDLPATFAPADVATFGGSIVVPASTLLACSTTADAANDDGSAGNNATAVNDNPGGPPRLFVAVRSVGGKSTSTSASFTVLAASVGGGQTAGPTSTSTGVVPVPVPVPVSPPPPPSQLVDGMPQSSVVAPDAIVEPGRRRFLFHVPGGKTVGSTVQLLTRAGAPDLIVQSLDGRRSTTPSMQHGAAASRTAVASVTITPERVCTVPDEYVPGHPYHQGPEWEAAKAAVYARGCMARAIVRRRPGAPADSDGSIPVPAFTLFFRGNASTATLASGVGVEDSASGDEPAYFAFELPQAGARVVLTVTAMDGTDLTLVAAMHPKPDLDYFTWRAPAGESTLVIEDAPAGTMYFAIIADARKLFAGREKTAFSVLAESSFAGTGTTGGTGNAPSSSSSSGSGASSSSSSSSSSSGGSGSGSGSGGAATSAPTSAPDVQLQRLTSSVAVDSVVEAGQTKYFVFSTAQTDVGDVVIRATPRGTAATLALRVNMCSSLNRCTSPQEELPSSTSARWEADAFGADQSLRIRPTFRIEPARAGVEQGGCQAASPCAYVIAVHSPPGSSGSGSSSGGGNPMVPFSIVATHVTNTTVHWLVPGRPVLGASPRFGGIVYAVTLTRPTDELSIAVTALSGEPNVYVAVCGVGADNATCSTNPDADTHTEQHVSQGSEAFVVGDTVLDDGTGTGTGTGSTASTPTPPATTTSAQLRCNPTPEELAAAPNGYSCVYYLAVRGLFGVPTSFSITATLRHKDDGDGGTGTGDDKTTTTATELIAGVPQAGAVWAGEGQEYRIRIPVFGHGSGSGTLLTAAHQRIRVALTNTEGDADLYLSLGTGADPRPNVAKPIKCGNFCNANGLQPDACNCGVCGSDARRCADWCWADIAGQGNAKAPGGSTSTSAATVCPASAETAKGYDLKSEHDADDTVTIQTTGPLFKTHCLDAAKARQSKKSGGTSSGSGSSCLLRIIAWGAGPQNSKSRFSIRLAMSDTVTALQPGVAVRESVAPGHDVFYSILVPSPPPPASSTSSSSSSSTPSSQVQVQLRFALTPLAGNPDMYVSTSVPYPGPGKTAHTWEAKSAMQQDIITATSSHWGWCSDRQLVLAPDGQGRACRFFVAVRATQAFGASGLASFTLLASYSSTAVNATTTTLLVEGLPQRAQVGGETALRYFRFRVPDQGASSSPSSKHLAVAFRPSSVTGGELELYVNSVDHCRRSGGEACLSGLPFLGKCLSSAAAEAPPGSASAYTDCVQGWLWSSTSGVTTPDGAVYIRANDPRAGSEYFIAAYAASLEPGQTALSFTLTTMVARPSARPPPGETPYAGDAPATTLPAWEAFHAHGVATRATAAATDDLTWHATYRFEVVDPTKDVLILVDSSKTNATSAGTGTGTGTGAGPLSSSSSRPVASKVEVGMDIAAYPVTHPSKTKGQFHAEQASELRVSSAALGALCTPSLSDGPCTYYLNVRLRIPGAAPFVRGVKGTNVQCASSDGSSDGDGDDAGMVQWKYESISSKAGCEAASKALGEAGRSGVVTVASGDKPAGCYQDDDVAPGVTFWNSFVSGVTKPSSTATPLCSLRPASAQPFAGGKGSTGPQVHVAYVVTVQLPVPPTPTTAPTIVSQGGAGGSTVGGADVAKAADTDAAARASTSTASTSSSSHSAEIVGAVFGSLIAAMLVCPALYVMHKRNLRLRERLAYELNDVRNVAGIGGMAMRPDEVQGLPLTAGGSLSSGGDEVTDASASSRTQTQRSSTRRSLLRWAAPAATWKSSGGDVGVGAGSSSPSLSSPKTKTKKKQKKQRRVTSGGSRRTFTRLGEDEECGEVAADTHIHAGDEAEEESASSSSSLPPPPRPSSAAAASSSLLATAVAEADRDVEDVSRST